MGSARAFVPLIFLVFLSLYTLTSGGHFTSSDDVQKLKVLRALIEHGTVAIEGGWASGLDGKTYAWFPLGASLIMLPGYWLGHGLAALVPAIPSEIAIRFAIVLQNAAISAGLVAVFAAFLRHLGASLGGTLFATVGLGAATMVWPYAKTAWSEPAATLLLFAGLVALCRALGSARAGLRWFSIGGLLLAGAVLIRQEMIIAAAGATAFLAWHRRHDGPALAGGLAALAVPMAIAVAICAWYNHARYGSPAAFPNYTQPQRYVEAVYGRLAWAARSLMHYTVHPSQGMAFFSPAVLIGMWGFRRWAASHSAVSGLFLASLLPLAVFYVVGWGPSSWAWGLRYAYPFLPFLMLPAAAVWEAAGRARLWATGVVALGVAVQVLGVLHNPLHLFQRVLEVHRDWTIVELLSRPDHSPIWLAAQATAPVIASAVELLAYPPATPIAVDAPMLGLPDLWPILHLQMGLHWAPAALVAALLITAMLWGVLRLRALLAPQPEAAAPPGRVAGLDAIRFVCALWVAISHLGLPKLPAMEAFGPLGWAIAGLYKMAVSGPAAVIVFFVISGYCIHHPYRDGQTPPWAGFFLARHLRIWLPLLAALLVASWLGLSFASFEVTILWSLFAELIYYTLYPLLRQAWLKLGWRNALIGAFLLAYAVVMTQPGAGNYPSYGLWLNWLLGLPCWLLGCKLADEDGLRQSPGARIWAWRLGVWTASVACMALRFKTPVGYPWTLDLFAILVYFWLAREIAYFRQARPLPLLERLGTFSYSLYLMHFPFLLILQPIVPVSLEHPIGWALFMVAMVSFCWGYFLLVERPAHQLARRVKNLAWPAIGRLAPPPVKP